MEGKILTLNLVEGVFSRAILIFILEVCFLPNRLKEDEKLQMVLGKNIFQLGDHICAPRRWGISLYLSLSKQLLTCYMKDKFLKIAKFLLLP